MSTLYRPPSEPYLCLHFLLQVLSDGAFTQIVDSLYLGQMISEKRGARLRIRPFNCLTPGYHAEYDHLKALGVSYILNCSDKSPRGELLPYVREHFEYQHFPMLDTDSQKLEVLYLGISDRIVEC